jgi:hypothetical protein
MQFSHESVVIDADSLPSAKKCGSWMKMVQLTSPSFASGARDTGTSPIEIVRCAKQESDSIRGPFIAS